MVFHLDQDPKTGKVCPQTPAGAKNSKDWCLSVAKRTVGGSESGGTVLGTTWMPKLPLGQGKCPSRVNALAVQICILLFLPFSSANPVPSDPGHSGVKHQPLRNIFQPYLISLDAQFIQRHHHLGLAVVHSLLLFFLEFGSDANPMAFPDKTETTNSRKFVMRDKESNIEFMFYRVVLSKNVATSTG
jgi:hypothetical protein